MDEPTATEAAAEAPPAVPGGVLTKKASGQAFTVHLDNFEGPFDLLLGLISKHQLDITEIALARVTDEFMAYLRALQQADPGWDLGQTSEFLLVAATLLDLKAARLLPTTGEVDEEDLELIEARDLLFARLMQYRAFKQVAARFGEEMAVNGRMTARQAGLEPRFASLLPELVMHVTPEQLVLVAARALTPKEEPTVGLTHLHAPAVSVREQAGIIGERLRREGTCSFRSLVADAGTTLVIVARFLALLELFRDQQVGLEQPEALGEISVRWVGAADGAIEVSDEFDEGDEPSDAADDADGEPSPAEQDQHQRDQEDPDE